MDVVIWLLSAVLGLQLALGAWEFLTERRRVSLHEEIGILATGNSSLKADCAGLKSEQEAMQRRAGELEKAIGKLAEEKQLREGLVDQVGGLRTESETMKNDLVGQVAALVARVDGIEKRLQVLLDELADRVLALESAPGPESAAKPGPAPAEPRPAARGPAAPEPEGVPALGLEVDGLRLQWRDFQREYPGLVAAAEQQAEAAEAAVWQDLLHELPRSVAFHPELRPAVEDLLAAPRERYKQLHQLALIPKWLGHDSASTSPEVRQRRIEQTRQLLRQLGSRVQAGELLAFDLEAFLRGPFLKTSDYLLRTRQQERLDLPESSLEAAREAVVRLLRHIQVEPIEFELGVTPFDPGLQKGRSSVNEPRFPDGVVMSVVQTGFKDLRHRQLLQEPQVVVNRKTAESNP